MMLFQVSNVRIFVNDRAKNEWKDAVHCPRILLKVLRKIYENSQPYQCPGGEFGTTRNGGHNHFAV
jgi:hypothetical protein